MPANNNGAVSGFILGHHSVVLTLDRCRVGKRQNRRIDMHASHIFALAVCIGIVAGLRAVTAPAVVSWAARLGWLNLHGSILAFMGTTVAAVIFSLGAIGEYVNDQLPRTPPRTAPSQFAARIVMGGLSGACLCVRRPRRRSSPGRSWERSAR